MLLLRENTLIFQKN